MASDFLPELSPEQAYAHKFAARELAKYTEEFYRWRKTKRAIASLDKPLHVPDPLTPYRKKPETSGSRVPH